MLGWSIGFFLAAVVAAVFGFGGIASAFAGIAQILFYLFLVLFVASLVFGLFFRGAAHAGDGVVHGHGGTGAFGFIALVALAAIGIYAWVDNDMSAERVGRAIDRSAVAITADAGDAIQEAGGRVEEVTEETGDAVRNDTANFFETASDNVRNADNN